MTLRRLALFFISSLVVVALTACSSEQPESPQAIELHAERGPVSMTVTVDPPSVDVGTPIEYRITVFAEPGIEITFPQFGEKLGVFDIIAQDLPPDIPVDNQRKWSTTLTLETFETGDIEIPETVVKFTDSREAVSDDEPIASEIRVEAIAVEVQSVLSKETKQRIAAIEAVPTLSDTAADFRDIRGAKELPRSFVANWWMWGLVLFAIIVVILAIVYVMIRKRSAAEPAAIILPPHIWARQELDHLAAENHVAEGRFQMFYFRLSDIVRQYLERRFTLHAPERTTDEFLREMQRSNVLSEGHKVLLSEFLRSADMVKFAKHRPPHTECERAFEAAGAFVDETALRECTPVARSTEAAA